MYIYICVYIYIYIYIYIFTYYIFKYKVSRSDQLYYITSITYIIIKVYITAIANNMA